MEYLLTIKSVRDHEAGTVRQNLVKKSLVIRTVSLISESVSANANGVHAIKIVHTGCPLKAQYRVQFIKEMEGRKEGNI